MKSICRQREDVYLSVSYRSLRNYGWWTLHLGLRGHVPFRRKTCKLKVKWIHLAIQVLRLVSRVAVVGNVDAGKSTLLGVLTHGELDNGRGFARQKLFRHKHEMESGRTSSVGNDILGFDQEGQVGFCYWSGPNVRAVNEHSKSKKKKVIAPILISFKTSKYFLSRTAIG